MRVSAPISWLILLSLVWLPLPTSSRCNNQFEEDTGANGEDIWRSRSDSCFTPEQSVSFGTIKLGREMQMTFDFTWNNYTFDPRGPPYDDYEEFFRVGCSAFEDLTPGSPCSGGDGCAGLGARYPSFSVTPPFHTNGSDFGPPKMYLSVSALGDCYESMELTEWGELEIGVKLHIDIFWDSQQVIVDIGQYSNYIQDPATFPEKSIKFQRTAGTNERYIGWDMPVWFMSNKDTDPLLNRGDAVIENIQIISKDFADTTTPGPDSTTDTKTKTTMANTDADDGKFEFYMPRWQVIMLVVFLTTVFLVVSTCLAICWWQNRQFKKKINSPEFRAQVAEEIKRRREARRKQMEAESGGAIATSGGPDTKDADRKSLLDNDGNVLQQQDNEMEMVQLADKEDGVETLNTDIVEEEES